MSSYHPPLVSKNAHYAYFRMKVSECAFFFTLSDAPCVRHPDLAFDRVPPALQRYRRPGIGWVGRPGQASAHMTYDGISRLRCLVVQGPRLSIPGINLKIKKIYFVRSWYIFISSATHSASLLSLPQNPYASITARSFF